MSKLRTRRRTYPFQGDYALYPSFPREDAVCVPLTQNRHAIVSVKHYDLVADILWHFDKGYAVTNCGKAPKRYTQSMNNLILSPPKGMHVDHKNRDNLDNTESNLRLATCSQNQANKAAQMGRKLKGAYKAAKSNKWFSTIRVRNERIYLGTHASEIEAAKAYDQAAFKHFGEYALLNFPQERI